MRGSRGALHQRDRRRARPPAARRRQGDRPAQPPRLVELPLLPLVRPGLGLPAVRRLARAPPRRGDRSPATTAATASAVPRRCPRLRLGQRRPPRPRHRAPRARAGRARSAATATRCSASTATSPPPGDAPPPCCARFEQAPPGVLIGTQMVAKGHDFDDVGLGVVLDADATLRFPDFRAEERTFALVAQLAGRAGRGPSGGGGRVLVQTLAPGASSIALRRPPRQRRLPRRRARPPRGAALPAVRRADPDRLLARRRPAPPTPPPRRSAPSSWCRAPPCSGRRRCFACAGASAPSWWSRAASGRCTVAARRRRGRRRRPRRDVAISVDVDPQ